MKLTIILVFSIGLTSIFSFQQDKLAEDVPFTYDKKDFISVKKKFEKKATSNDGSVKAGFPVDLPAHNCFSLEDKKEFPAFEKGARYFHPAYSFICVIPTSDKTEPDFAKSYPNFNIAISKLNKLLENKPSKFKQFQDLFDVPYNNSGWSFKSKIQYLDYQNVLGVFFLTQYSQDLTPNLANNEELTANFQGLTKDRKYYIAARFGVTHPLLPKGIDFTEGKVIDEAFSTPTVAELNKKVVLYLNAEEEKLEKFSEDSFQPSLKSLKNLIASVSIK